jgi:hypothetical protein
MDKPQSAIRNPQSAMDKPQSALANPQSAMDKPQSALANPQSAMDKPQSAIRNPQSAIDYFTTTPHGDPPVVMRRSTAPVARSTTDTSPEGPFAV